MIKRAWLFGILLTVPVVAYGVAVGIQAKMNSEVQSVLRREYPNSTAEQRASITVDRMCQDPTPGLSELCSTNHNLNLMRHASVGAAIIGLLLLLAIYLAGLLARNSRGLLLALFGFGLHVTVVALVGLILAHAALAMAAIYYGESALLGRIHVFLIVAIGFGALVGVVKMVGAASSVVRKAQTAVIGKALSREQAPQLWKHIDDTADRLGALRPDHLVVGLDANFFVTEADVSCLTGSHKGRTIYCSLPLCRILSKDEFTSVIGHELGHFKGQDTAFSKRFYPIYRGTSSSLVALYAAGGEGSRAIALLPAVAVLSYFLECFAVAESRFSRDRELLADRAGASVTTSHILAAALVKLHAFAGVWDVLQEAVVENLRQGKIFVNASSTYAEAVRGSAVPAALEGLAGSHLSHPTDSHPPLSVRLLSLQVSLDDVTRESLDVTPADPAIALIPDAEKQEEEVGDAYQLQLARQLGTSLDTPAGTANAPVTTDSE